MKRTKDLIKGLRHLITPGQQAAKMEQQIEEQMREQAAVNEQNKVQRLAWEQEGLRQGLNFSRAIQAAATLRASSVMAIDSSHVKKIRKEAAALQDREQAARIERLAQSEELKEAVQQILSFSLEIEGLAQTILDNHSRLAALEEERQQQPVDMYNDIAGKLDLSSLFFQGPIA